MKLFKSDRERESKKGKTHFLFTECFSFLRFPVSNMFFLYFSIGRDKKYKLSTSSSGLEFGSEDFNPKNVTITLALALQKRFQILSMDVRGSL